MYFSNNSDIRSFMCKIFTVCSSAYICVIVSFLIFFFSVAGESLQRRDIDDPKASLESPAATHLSRREGRRKCDESDDVGIMRRKSRRQPGKNGSTENELWISRPRD